MDFFPKIPDLPPNNMGVGIVKIWFHNLGNSFDSGLDSRLEACRRAGRADQFHEEPPATGSARIRSRTAAAIPGRLGTPATAGG